MTVYCSLIQPNIPNSMSVAYIGMLIYPFLFSEVLHSMKKKNNVCYVKKKNASQTPLYLGTASNDVAENTGF